MLLQGNSASNGRVGLLYKKRFALGNCVTCTAFAISDRHIMTAAHCVYCKRSGDPQISVTFGKVGWKDPGLGNVKIEKCAHPEQYKDDGIIEYDYAVCLLSDPNPDGVDIYTSSATTRIDFDAPVTTTGYPLHETPGQILVCWALC